MKWPSKPYCRPTLKVIHITVEEGFTSSTDGFLEDIDGSKEEDSWWDYIAL